MIVWNELHQGMYMESIMFFVRTKGKRVLSVVAISNCN